MLTRFRPQKQSYVSPQKGPFSANFQQKNATWCRKWPTGGVCHLAEKFIPQKMEPLSEEIFIVMLDLARRRKCIHDFWKLLRQQN